MYSMIQTGAQFGMLTPTSACSTWSAATRSRTSRPRTYASSRKHSSAKELLMDRDQATRFIHDLPAAAAEQEGRTCSSTAEFPPAFKVDGRVTPVSNQPLMAQHTAELVGGDHERRQAAEFESSRECNSPSARPASAASGCSAFVQQGKGRHRFRVIADKIPTAEELNLPTIVNDLAMAKRGIVMMVGATGCGKSTTLAAMVGYRKREQPGSHHHHRGPRFEYVHQHRNCNRQPTATSAWNCERLAGGAEETLAMAAGRDPDRTWCASARRWSTRSPSPRTGHCDVHAVHANSTNQALDRGDQLLPRGESARQLLMDLVAETCGRWCRSADRPEDRKGAHPGGRDHAHSPMIRTESSKATVSGDPGW